MMSIMRMARDLVSETVCFVFFKILDDGHVQEPRNPECYTPSSETLEPTENTVI
jgi:hypothetical protein